jgi:type-F conjugative transfer system pilin assembly protein TrbC
MKIIQKMGYLLMLYLLTSSSFASNIIIFVSFSMPKESIKQWIKEGQEINAPVVIRGLINNSFKETINVLYQLNKESTGGVQLDPTLFKKYQIDKVPAVLVTDTEHCLSNQTCKKHDDVVYGDVTLFYALKKIAMQDDEVSSFANEALKKLKDNHEF